MPRGSLVCAALAAASFALMLGGCGDDVERGQKQVYETRDLPEYDDIYSASARSSWHGDLQVYELPRQPPGEADRRKPCAVPGPAFGPAPQVEIGDMPGGTHDIELQPMVAYDTRPEPVNGARRLPLTPTTGQGDRPPGPALVTWPLRRVAAYDSRPEPGESIYLRQAPETAIIGEQAVDDYCLPETPIPDPVGRGVGVQKGAIGAPAAPAAAAAP